MYMNTWQKVRSHIPRSNIPKITPCLLQASRCIIFLTFSPSFLSLLLTGHFHYAKYLEKLVTVRLAAKENGAQSVQDDDECRSRILCNDVFCQKYIQRAILHYSMALMHDLKHVYQALPRLLSLWFDFTGIELNQGKNSIYVSSFTISYTATLCHYVTPFLTPFTFSIVIRKRKCAPF